MELEELALCTREEFEQELNKLYPEPTDDMNPGDYDAALNKRASIIQRVRMLRIKALLDGKLTVDQVVDQEHSDNQDLDGIHRGILEKALEMLREGEDRDVIIEETFNALELL